MSLSKTQPVIYDPRTLAVVNQAFAVISSETYATPKKKPPERHHAPVPEGAEEIEEQSLAA